MKKNAKGAANKRAANKRVKPKKQNKVRTVVGVILLVILAVGIFCLVYFTGATNSIAKIGKYNVQVNGETYYSDTATAELSLPDESDELKFSVQNGGDCTIKIVPNTECDVTFTCRGKEYRLVDESDLTYCFALKMDDGAFAIVGGDYSLYTVLTYIYGDEVAFTSQLPDTPYKLVITSESGDTIEFLLAAPKISNITIDPDSVTF